MAFVLALCLVSGIIANFLGVIYFSYGIKIKINDDRFRFDIYQEWIFALILMIFYYILYGLSALGVFEENITRAMVWGEHVIYLGVITQFIIISAHIKTWGLRGNAGREGRLELMKFMDVVDKFYSPVFKSIFIIISLVSVLYVGVMPVESMDLNETKEFYASFYSTGFYGVDIYFGVFRIVLMIIVYILMPKKPPYHFLRFGVLTAILGIHSLEIAVFLLPDPPRIVLDIIWGSLILSWLFFLVTIIEHIIWKKNNPM